MMTMYSFVTFVGRERFYGRCARRHRAWVTVLATNWGTRELRTSHRKSYRARKYSVGYFTNLIGQIFATEFGLHCKALSVLAP
jgi:hypothetical protein